MTRSAVTGWTCLYLGLLLGRAWAEPSVIDQVPPDRLTILHTNGLRGAFGPHDYFGQQRGGLARLVHLIRALDGPSTLVVDGGDALGPHPVSQFDGGAVFTRLMRRAGFDAIVPGNHDLNYGLDVLRGRVAETDMLFLGANVSYATQDTLFRPALQRSFGGVQILVIGLVSPSVAGSVHPLRARGLKISNPTEALRAALDGQDRRHLLPIVVAHMPPMEVLGLARAFPEVPLFLAGDNPQARDVGGSVHVLELASGTRIVSTPERGSSLGKMGFCLTRSEDGALCLTDFDAELIPVNGQIDEDEETTRQIDRLTASYRQSRQTPLADLEVSIDDPRQFVADLMRQHVRAEVAVINHGAMRDMSLPAGEVVAADIDSLIRFNDVMVQVSLSGTQLRKMSAASASASREGQRLIFAGFEPEAESIGGIPIEATENYRVVTTAFLAGGGDGHLPAMDIESSMTDSLDLSKMVTRFLQQHARPVLALRGQPQRVIYKTSSKFSSALSRTSVDDDASRYADVATLRGDDALAWNAQWQMKALRLSRRGTLSLDLKSAFGQVRNETSGAFREATDRIDAESVYAWRRSAGPAPFVSLSLASVWTGPKLGDRPLRIRAASGLHRALGSGGALRLGLGWEHDVAGGRSQLGIELSPEVERRLPNGSRLTSSAKLFAGFTDRRSVSVQHYNALIVALKGNLNASVDFNLFLHWDTQIDRLATRSELQVGLTYLLVGRRAR